MSQASSTAQKPVNPLRVRDFRLLWIGESVSLLGDQFYLIALPWLVLQMTGSALALGTVLALASIPRALFMLIGGAFVDRFSPRSVMFASNFIRMILVGLLALLVLIGSIQLWMLYVLALAFGTADAFFFPAESAIVPALLDSDQLELGNTLTQGVATLSMFVGPALAGIVIAVLASSSTKATPDMAGIGVAFALDTFSFLASLVTLWIMHTHNSVEGTEGSNVWDSIKAGLAYLWQNAILRSVFFCCSPSICSLSVHFKSAFRCWRNAILWKAQRHLASWCPPSAVGRCSESSSQASCPSRDRLGSGQYS